MGLDVTMYRSRLTAEEIQEGWRREWEGGPRVEAEEVDIPSSAHPNHTFRIGYWRSSYNPGGFNNVMHAAGCPGIYEITGADNGDLAAIDWQASLERLREAREAYRTYTSNGNYRALHVSHYDLPDTNPTSEEDALVLFSSEAENRVPGMGGWSSAKGFFNPNEGLDVRAVLPGKDILGNPCVWVIYKGSPEDAQYYLEALDVMEETLLYGLENDGKDGEHLYLSFWG